MEIRLLDSITDEDILFNIVKMEDEVFKDASIGNYNIKPMAKYGRVYAILDGENVIVSNEVMKSFQNDLAYIYGLITNPIYQNKKMAYNLLDYVLDDLKKLGIRKVQLTTSIENTYANKLYSKFNFKKICILEDEYKDKERKIFI